MWPDFNDFGILFIDVQEKLLSAMKRKVADITLKNCEILAQLAVDFDAEIYYTEQYPKGLGKTHPLLQRHLNHARRVEKIAFSCLDDSTFCEQVAIDWPSSLIVCGLETHICVLNTLIHAIADDKNEERDFFLPVDATCSRHKLHWQNAQVQLENFGVITTNTETLVFQALGDASNEHFKKYSMLIR